MTADHTSHTGHSSHATPTAPPVTAVTASPRTPNCPAVVQPPERGQFRLRGIGHSPGPGRESDPSAPKNGARRPPKHHHRAHRPASATPKAPLQGSRTQIFLALTAET